MRITDEDIAILVMVLIFLAIANIFPSSVITKGYAAASANITVEVINPPPVILSYYPLTNPNITEEEVQAFNVSFTDDNEPELNVMWNLDGDLVKQEAKGVPNSSDYIFVADYSSAGQHNVSASVSNRGQSLILIWGLNVSNVNRVPYFETIPNMEWYQGSSHTMSSLDDYAVDPDVGIDDSLSYEIVFVSEPSQIQARIDPITHEVLFRSVHSFYGSEIVYFKVTDSWGAFNYSNNITLTVKQIPSARVMGGGGDTGGGGRGLGRVYDDRCENYWYCGSWGPCDPINNSRTRECIDLALCPVGRNKPIEIENCTYIPTCYDGIKNADEIGIDCGGECPPCWTCYDGIKNQGEDGIDCDGPCAPCSSCDDGMRNCRRLDKETVLCEKGVDCGGPCPKDCCENEYFDLNLGEEGIDCGGACEECEFLAPESRLQRIIRSGIFISSLIVLSIVGLAVGFSMIRLGYRKKKLPAAMKKDVVFKDLKRMYVEVEDLEKIVDSVPNEKIIKLLLYVTTRLIHYRYHINLSCTAEELLREMSKLRKEKVIRHELMHLYSRLYYLKYSGGEVSKEDILEYIKKVKALNYMTLHKIYLQTMVKSKKESSLLRILNFVGIGAREDQITSELRLENKMVKPRIKRKIAAVFFVVLTLVVVFGLLLIPQQPKSGYSIGGGAINESKVAEVSIEPATLKGRNLFLEFVNRIIGSIRTVGRAPGITPPQFFNVNDGDRLTSAEDSNASFLIQAIDDGDDPLTFSFLEEEVSSKLVFQMIPSTLEMYNKTSALINFIPTEEYVYDSNTVVGGYIVTIVVKDTSEMSDSVWVIFNVTNVNDAPDIPDYTPVSLTPTVNENSSIGFSFDNNTADPDLIHPGYDSITNEWYFDGIYNNSDVLWTYYPGFCDAGKYDVTLVVTDSKSLSADLTWEVTVQNVIRPPFNNKSFIGYDYLEWVEGGSVPAYDLILEQFFEDVDAVECSEPTAMTLGYETKSVDSVDGSELNIVIDDVDSSVNILAPHSDWSGVQVIRFYGDNGAASYSDVDIILNVTNLPDIPVLDHIPNQYLVVGYNYVYDVNATDADNDVLYFSDNATIFDIDTSTGIINFTPTTGGVYTVNISVNDSVFVVSQLVNFILDVANYPPNITRIYPYGTPLSNTTVYAFNYATLFPGDITSVNVMENTTVLFNQTSSDPEYDDLRCLWYLDGNLEEENTCADIPYWNYEVDFFQDGLRNVTLEVDDGRNNKDSFTWNVSVQNINRNPTFGEKKLSSYSEFSGGTENQTSIMLELGSITLGKTSAVTYNTRGTYISPVIDLQAHYARTNIESVSWSELKPSGTNVIFRVRTSDTAAGISAVNWSDIYYDGFGEINLGGRYVQLKVEMVTNDSSITPKVEEVTIEYGIKNNKITGNYQSWINLNNFFDDKDGTRLRYVYEDIAGSDILGLIIDNESDIVSLYPTASGNAIFRFVANDSYSIVYSNNVTLQIELVELQVPSVTIVSPSSGGGGGGIRKTIIVPKSEVKYQQLIYVGSLDVTSNRTIIAPIILKNTGNEVLRSIYLSAKTDMSNISFRFERDYIPSIDMNRDVRTELYIMPARFINESYSIEVIADVKEPTLQDTSLININPLENITEKITFVMDLLQLHPVCRELEEVVIQAREALSNNRYEESYKLLTEVIDGCKYLVSAAEEKPVPKPPLVLRKKWTFIIILILVVVLLLAYFVPRLINRIRGPNLYKEKR